MAHMTTNAQAFRELRRKQDDELKTKQHEWYVSSAPFLIEEMKKRLFASKGDKFVFNTTSNILLSERRVYGECIRVEWISRFDVLQKTFYETHDRNQWSLKLKGWIYPYVELRML